MHYYSEFELIEPIIEILSIYKNLDSISIKEKEYVTYMLFKLDEFTVRVIRYGNKEEIFHLGNQLFDLWIEYDIHIYEKYFDKLQV